MQCVADEHYLVKRNKLGEISGLKCAFCEFWVAKYLTAIPSTSKSGLGRYNRMRGWMVKHLHEQHREKLRDTRARPSGWE